MRKILVLIIVSLMLAGCVAVPVYDSYDPYAYPYYGYPYYGYYGQYPYFAGPDVSLFFASGFHGRGFQGGHGFRGGHSFRGGGHGFHGFRR